MPMRLNEIIKKEKEKKYLFELKLFIYRDYDKCIFVPKLKDKFQRINRNICWPVLSNAMIVIQCEYSVFFVFCFFLHHNIVY